MASFSSSSSQMKNILVLVTFSCYCFYMLEGREYVVGGKPDAWKIPSSPSDSLNNWAESSRFQIGDSLVWKFDSKKDSVLQVHKKDYVTCNTTSPIEEYKDGNNTKVELHKSGPFYFISGAEGNCEKGQKLVVVVMSHRHHRRSFEGSPAPSPSAAFDGPAVAPSTGAATSLGSTLSFVVALVVLMMNGFF